VRGPLQEPSICRASTLTASLRSENWSGRDSRSHVGLFGLGMESLRDEDEISDWAKLFYSAGSVARPATPRTPGDRANYFGIPTEIGTFFGHWFDLPPIASAVLANLRRRAPCSRRRRFAFWDCQLKFRIGSVR
jgi:hypothetical protein